MAEPEQVETDYSGETADQLEERLAKGEGMVQDDPQESEPVQSEPDPPIEEEAKAQPEDQPTEPAEEDPAKGDPATETPAEPEFDERDSRIEELTLQLQQTELERKRSSFDRDRESGTMGALRQDMESLKATLAGQQAEPEYVGDDGTAQVHPVRSNSDPRVDELIAAEKQRGLETTYKSFEDGLRNEIVTELSVNGNQVADDAVASELQTRLEAMSPAIKQEIELYKNENLNTNAAIKVMDMALNSAKLGWQMARVRTTRQEALKRKVTQVDRRKAEKLAATDSAGGASPGPKSTIKSVEDMTAEEADRELSRLSGERRPR